MGGLGLAAPGPIGPVWPEEPPPGAAKNGTPETAGGGVLACYGCGRSDEHGGTRDVLGPNLTVLFVGYNPGLRSGQTGHHFAGPGNRFWDLLASSGLAPRRLFPAEDRLVLGLGYGLTNIVARTTPSCSDLSLSEIREGAALLRRKIDITAPRIVCYLGKGIYAQASGCDPAEVGWGLQPGELFAGSLDFVTPSPSGRATIPYAEKQAVFADLAGLVRQVVARLQEAWQAGFVSNVIEQALAMRPGETLTVVCDDERDELAALLAKSASRAGCRFEKRRLGRECLSRLGDTDGVVLAPSPTAWRDPSIRDLVRLPDGPAGRVRSLFLPPQPLENLYRVCSVPYRNHVAFHDRLMVTLRSARQVRITSPCGTDLSFCVRPFVAHTFSARQPGQFMLGIPGEVTTAPLETSAEGRLVFDVGVYMGPLSEWAAIEIREGLVVSVEREGRYDGSGAPPDPVLDHFLAELRERAVQWPDALRVGEFGLGTNSSARYSGCYVEDEAVMGSCHIDFGANTQFGGILSGPHHGGGVVSSPTVKVDGVMILKDGLYVERNLA